MCVFEIERMKNQMKTKTAGKRGGGTGEALDKASPDKLARPSAARKAGRPTAFHPRFVGEAAKLCALGATDMELADFFKISVSTLNQWKINYPEFSESIKSGKEPADDRVERSLFNRAVGFVYETEKIFLVDGKVLRVPIREHVPPDTAAAFIWLKNRRKEIWRDRHEHQLSGGLQYRISDKPMTPEEWLARHADVADERN
jgi:hypothetical protein